MLIQTISQAVIALFFLITMLAMLCFWIFAGAAFSALSRASGNASSSYSVPSSPASPDVTVIPPDPELQAKEQARRALRGAFSGSSSSRSLEGSIQDAGEQLARPVQDSVDSYSKRIIEDQRLRDQQAAEEKARRDWAPNGPRQK